MHLKAIFISYLISSLVVLIKLTWHWDFYCGANLNSGEKIESIQTLKIELNQILDSWFQLYNSEFMKITNCQMNAAGNLRLQHNDVKFLKHNNLSSGYEKVKELQAV